MNRNFYKKMKNYKEIKGFIQNEYIRTADILPIWNDIRNGRQAHLFREVRNRLNAELQDN